MSWQGSVGLVLTIAVASAQQTGNGRKADPELIRSVAITVTRLGCSPSPITLTPGKTALFFFNRTGMEEPVFQVEREAASSQLPAEKLYNQKARPGRRKSAAVIDLTPGNYVVSDPGRPGISCKISVSGGK